MSRCSGINLASALLCILLLVIGFFGGRISAKYQWKHQAVREQFEALRRIRDLEVSSSFMDRLLVVKDESVQYNNIRLILKVPVRISYHADLGLLNYKEQEDGSFLVELPPITRNEAKYDTDRAISLDLSAGFGKTDTWASYQDMYALFSQSVLNDRKALENELDRDSVKSNAQDALRRHLLAFAEVWGLEIRFENPEN